MQSYRNLYPTITAFSNLYTAFRKARQGKRNRPEVAAFEVDLETNLFQLQEELRERAYSPGAYRNFYIRERKLRLISAAPFCDRVVHHALCAVINPIWERRFIHDTYANRAGKGTHKALDRAQHFARGHAYVLQCDVHQFFPAIDHAILYEKLAHRIHDADTLWLIERILAGGAGILAPMYTMEYFPGDDLFAVLRPRGLPVGNLTSQSWANIYLDSLDQFVKRELKCRAYLRYADDFLLFHNDKAQLHAWKDAVQEHLAGLRLCLNGRRSVVYPTHTGIPFWAFVSSPPTAAYAPKMYGWRANACAAIVKRIRLDR
ncbi:MAG: reverse transcriptase domain-containing protein [Caldilineaceae bacterium]